jgi:hypothetical protein
LIGIHFALDLGFELVGLPRGSVSRGLCHSPRHLGLTQLQIEIGQLRLCVVHLFLHWFEAEHLDFDRPGTFAQQRKRVVPILVGGCDGILTILRRGNRRAWDRLVAGAHKSALRVDGRANGQEQQAAWHRVGQFQPLKLSSEPLTKYRRTISESGYSELGFELLLSARTRAEANLNWSVDRELYVVPAGH